MWRAGVGLVALVALTGTAATGLAAIASNAKTPVRAAALAGTLEIVSSPPVQGRRVLAVSVDGLNPSAIRQLGPDQAPTYYRLLRQGAATLNARTTVEQTVTLPNHASMLTGRRVDRSAGGHGVTWDDERPGTVQGAAGQPVSSVFSVVHAAGGSTALFTSKPKLSLFDRSWPADIDRFVVDEDQARLVRAVDADLLRSRRRFTMLHVSLPDLAGHASGFMSAAYVDAVRQSDRQLAKVLATIESSPQLRSQMVVIVTTDHGGEPGSISHDRATRIGDYRVPFLVWGAGVRPGDLYRLNPGYADPGTGRPSYAGRQPVRNADLADLATGLMGLGPVPGSQLGVRQSLRVLASR